jgi:hypothetical protein
LSISAVFFNYNKIPISKNYLKQQNYYCVKNGVYFIHVVCLVWDAGGGTVKEFKDLKDFKVWARYLINKPALRWDEQQKLHSTKLHQKFL